MESEKITKEEAINFMQEQLEIRIHQKTFLIENMLSGLTRDFKVFKTDQDDKHRELRQMIKAVADENRPVIEWFRNINFAKKALMWALGLVASVVGLILAIKELMSGK